MREVREVTGQLVIEASTVYRPDQLATYRAAIAAAADETSRWVLQQLLANAEVARAEQRPLCDDTGIPHLFLEVGAASGLRATHIAAMLHGVGDGLRALPGRAMAVLGDGRQRVEQSAGLSDDPAGVTPPALVVKPVDGASARLTVLMLGGGPEIRSRTFRVFHKRSLYAVLDEARAWAIEGTALLGCTPGVLALGIGRTHAEAGSLMLESMAHGDLRVQNEFEQYLTESVNAQGCGPLGLGGRPTVLGTFIRFGPQRASGVRIVCLRPGCCMDPRRASALFA